MINFEETVFGRVKQELLAISKVKHKYPEVIAQAEKVDWHEDFSSGYKGLYYFVPISLSPNYIRRLRVQVADVPMVRKVSSKLYQELRANRLQDIESILSICNALLQYWTWEYRTIAFDWSFRVKKQFKSQHFRIFEDWTKLYLSTWGGVDDFCTHTMGYFFYVFPEYVHHVKQWANSDNPWIRRAAAVSLIYGLRRGTLFSYIFDVANAMLTDPRKYVQNGYGWMLKEATKYFQNEVFDYVMQKKTIMPRRALRYAIEKMSKTQKAQAMA